MENGTIGVSPPFSQIIGTNPLHSYAAGPYYLVVISTEEFPVDLSQLINLPGTLVQVLLVKRSTPLFTPINYSPSDPFIIYVFAHASPHSLAQNKAWLTISHDPHPVVKPVLIIGGSEAKQASKIGGVARIGPVYQPKDLADAEERK